MGKEKKRKNKKKEKNKKQKRKTKKKKEAQEKKNLKKPKKRIFHPQKFSLSVEPKDSLFFVFSLSAFLFCEQIFLHNRHLFARMDGGV